MQMMYETIHKALGEVGLEDAYSPQDYLNFYCLGNREILDACDLSESHTSNTPQVLHSLSCLKYYDSFLYKFY